MELEDITPGTVITGFALKTPLTDDICRAHISQSLALGLPEVLGRRRLAVIANGPSAREADLHALSSDRSTLAVNGAIKLFLDQGLAPTYWACCDPQHYVLDYLPADPPRGTIYLVASKCHPSVFERLKGCDVRVWHLLDQTTTGKAHVPLACSITLCATWLLHRMGFTDFEYWGWDGCIMDGRDHAAHDIAQGIELHINYGGKIVDGEVIGGRNFGTSRSWAAEAQSAEQFFQLAKYFDISVKLNGDGMFQCAQEFILAP